MATGSIGLNSGGRDSAGRFMLGNAGGPGNPHAKRVAELRTLLIDAVSDDDLRAIVQALVAKARGGDMAAIKELFDRTIGRPVQPITAESPNAPYTFPLTPEQRQCLNGFRDRMRRITNKD